MTSTYQRAKAQMTEGKSPEELAFVITATKSSNPDHAEYIGKVWDRKAKAWVDFADTDTIVVKGRPKLSYKRGDTSYWNWRIGPQGAKAQMEALGNPSGIWVGTPTVAEFMKQREEAKRREKMVHFKATDYGRSVGFDVDNLMLVEEMLNSESTDDAVKQLNDGYAHGGGFSGFNGFEFDPTDQSIRYPGDPRMKPLAEAKLGNERLYFYEGEWVGVFREDGSFIIDRMD